MGAIKMYYSLALALGLFLMFVSADEANQSGEKFQAVRNAAQECGATNGTGRAAMRGFFHGQLQEASACFMFCVMEKLELVSEGPDGINFNADKMNTLAPKKFPSEIITKLTQACSGVDPKLEKCEYAIQLSKCFGANGKRRKEDQSR